MLTASAYISTQNRAIPDLNSSTYITVKGGITYDISPNGFVTYLNVINGNTFVSPFLPGPRYNFVNSSSYSGLTVSLVSQDDYYILRSLPLSRRGIQNFNNYYYTNYWVGDGITVSARSYSGYTGTWDTQTVNNSYPGPWPEKGICQSYKLLADWLQGACANGTIIDALFIDNESSPYNPGSLATDIYTALQNEKRYTESYYGLTSWDGIYSAYGGTGNPNIGKNYNAWWAAKDAYQAKAFQLSYLQAMLKYNPKSLTSNYTYFKEGEPAQGPRNSIWPQDGAILPHLEPGGNAASPELYGGMRQTVNQKIVKRDNGKELDVGGFTNYFRAFNKRFNMGPWASFVLTLAEARSAKRGSPSTPLTPWIGSVDWYGPNYNRYEKEYGINGDYSGGRGYQTPAEVLDTTWYRKDVTVNAGFTAYDGSTAAYRITTVAGTTNAYLSYYVNNMTMGITYIFSYYTNLDTGLTNPANVYQSINHFKTWTYNYPRGITFQRNLPSATGPFYAETQSDYSGYTGWQKVSYKFQTVKPFSDITDNLTVALSIFGCSGATSDIAGKTAYVSHPELQIEGSCGNIPLFVRSPTDVYNYIDWCFAPPSGFGDLKLGYNSRQALYVTQFAGHSGYWYDYVRHLALLGSKYFGYFNSAQFVDMGYTGAFQKWIDYGKSENYYFTCTQAFDNGWTAWLTEQTEFNDCLKDINSRLGGFTLTTADYSEYDWNSTYMANGAPELNGNTWWWRVTVKPGYTMICNGITLSSASGYPVGTWVSTTGPTLAGIGITWSPWQLPSEPGYTAPNKTFDFIGMTYNNRVKEVGFNFTRSTTATYIGSSGYLMTAAINEPRLDYDPDTLTPNGLLLEPTATNWLNWSESFATSGGCNNNWIDINVSRTTGVTSPSGNTTAIRFTATQANGMLIATEGVTSGTIYGTWSCWFRGVSGTESLYITLDGGTSWTQIKNLSTKWKRTGSQLTSTDVGMTYSPFYMGFKLGNTNDSVEIWGAQVEERRLSWGAQSAMDPLVYVDYTSYIQSGATRGIRGNEKCWISGTSFSSWFSITQGTFLYDTKNNYDIVVSNSSAYYTGPLEYYIASNPLIICRRYGTDQQAGLYGLVPWAYPQSSYPLNLPIKSIISYWPYGLKISSNGGLSTNTYTGTTSYIYNYNQLSLTTIFGQVEDRPHSQSYIRKIMYWNYIWNDADMKAMSLANVEQVTTFNPYG